MKNLRDRSCFVNGLQSKNKAARNKRNSWRAAYQVRGESCLSWIKRTREENLDRASESTQWDLHLQADRSVTDSGWLNKDIQWLAERQRWDNYYWAQDSSYHAGHKMLHIEGDCIYQGAQDREREKVKVTNFCSCSLGLAVPCFLGYVG